jgi:hypothetical protein
MLVDDPTPVEDVHQCCQVAGFRKKKYWPRESGGRESGRDHHKTGGRQHKCNEMTNMTTGAWECPKLFCLEDSRDGQILFL